MDRGAWRATVQSHEDSDTSETTLACMHAYTEILLKIFISKWGSLIHGKSYHV